MHVCFHITLFPKGPILIATYHQQFCFISYGIFFKGHQNVFFIIRNQFPFKCSVNKKKKNRQNDNRDSLNCKLILILRLG